MFYHHTNIVVVIQIICGIFGLHSITTVDSYARVVKQGDILQYSNKNQTQQQQQQGNKRYVIQCLSI